MEPNFEKTVQERAVLVGLNADCFTKAQTATDETLEELEALLETAGGAIIPVGRRGDELLSALLEAR